MFRKMRPNLANSQQHFQKKKVDSNPVYKEKYIKTKIKVYSKKISTDFHGNKKPKESSEWNFARFSLQKR